MTPQATGRHEVRQGQDILVLTRTFRSSIEHVWAAVTQPDRMASWIGTWDGDPASGSVQFRMTAEGDDAAEQPWEIRTCEPPHTLVVRSSDDSGVWELRLRLSEHDGITALEFAQVIHDASVLESVGPGWEYYLDRLVAAEAGGDVSSIDFEPGYYPDLSGHYAALMTHGDYIISHIGTAMMYVSNQEESRRFYCDVLGFSVVSDQEMGDDRWLELAPPEGSTTIALHDAAKAGKKPGEGAYLTFACDDVAATVDELRRGGAEVTDPDEQAWGTFAFVQGPDGLRVQIHSK